jgi:hypothetical protein
VHETGGVKVQVVYRTLMGNDEMGVDDYLYQLSTTIVRVRCIHMWNIHKGAYECQQQVQIDIDIRIKVTGTVVRRRSMGKYSAFAGKAPAAAHVTTATVSRAAVQQLQRMIRLPISSNNK